jgi:hypothetical protein
LTTLVYPTTLVAGANENVNDLNSNLNAITAVINGAIDSSNIANAGVSANNLSTALAQFLGITNVANTGRGTSIITATESRTNTAYGTLTTPDQVTGIVLPTNGLITVWYQATWQESVDGAASAAVFLGSNQLVGAMVNAAAASTAGASVASIGCGTAAIDKPLASYAGGLISNQGFVSATAYSTGDVTTGQIVGQNILTPTVLIPAGGPITIFAAAGTYTISVRFKSTSGSMTAKNRKLWCVTTGF